MKTYMLVFTGKHESWNNKTEQEWKVLNQKHEEWLKKIIGDWSGAKLASSPSKLLFEQNGESIVKDGPFSETKEVLTGFYLIKAENIDRATEIAKGNPWLLHDQMEIFETDN